MMATTFEDPSAHVLLPEITRLLAEQDAGEVLVFAGGIIPEPDAPGLREAGIDEIFLPGTATGDIVDYLNRRLGKTSASTAVTSEAK